MTFWFWLAGNVDQKEWVHHAEIDKLFQKKIIPFWHRKLPNDSTYIINGPTRIFAYKIISICSCLKKYNLMLLPKKAVVWMNFFSFAFCLSLFLCHVLSDWSWVAVFVRGAQRAAWTEADKELVYASRSELQHLQLLSGFGLDCAATNPAELPHTVWSVGAVVHRPGVCSPPLGAENPLPLN